MTTAIRKLLAVAAFVGLLWPAAAGAADVGNVAVIEDNGSIITTVGLAHMIDLKEAGKAFFIGHHDEFDFLTVLASGGVGMVTTPIHAEPARIPAEGIGATPLYGTPSDYGSAGRLLSAAFIGSLGMYPEDPGTFLAVIPHEIGHAWLGKIRYDLGDGQGPRKDLLGESTWHWSFYFDSGSSVMYGNTLTDNGNGTFTLSGSSNREYGPLDQYLMGLRPAAEVPPFFVGVPDPSEPFTPDQSPLAAGGTKTVKGAVRRVTVADVIKAEGPRAPSYGDAQCHFRNAFILVVSKGASATGAEIAKLDGLRTGWQEFFASATGGRGSIDTTLDGRFSPGTCEGGADAGATDRGRDAETDASTDAGTADGSADAETDTRAAEETTDTGTDAEIGDTGGDAGTTDDVVVPSTDADGRGPDTSAESENAGGCSCSVLSLRGIR
ncbi:MAG: hypothetical protein HY897_20170 [Deltaproteobacteria bacterium]|nr:hypothetical protein [Deltaproteobacteria bacterium]